MRLVSSSVCLAIINPWEGLLDHVVMLFLFSFWMRCFRRLLSRCLISLASFSQILKWVMKIPLVESCVKGTNLYSS